MNFTSGGATGVVDIDLSVANTDALKLTATTDQVVAAIQAKLDTATGAGGLGLAKSQCLMTTQLESFCSSRPLRPTPSH